MYPTTNASHGGPREIKPAMSAHKTTLMHSYIRAHTYTYTQRSSSWMLLSLVSVLARAGCDFIKHEQDENTTGRLHTDVVK